MKTLDDEGCVIANVEEKAALRVGARQQPDRGQGGPGAGVRGWNGGREAGVGTGSDSRGRLGREALWETPAFEDGVLLG